MNQKHIVVAIDIGTTKVCTIIGEKSENGIEILGVGSHPSHGLKKGSVVNIDKTVKSISNSIEEAKLMAGVESVTSATIGIAGNHIYCFNSSGVVAVKNKEINSQDIDRVIESAKAVLIPSDRETLHVIPQEFRVDNTTGVKNPIGMCGSRLEAHVHVVTGKTPLIQNLVKCVEQVGIRVENIILQPIASSRSVLTQEEKELGVVLLDIGGGTTDIAVWKDGSLIHSQIIPIGGNHFTNDLAVALKIPHVEAERIKVNHGSVLSETLNPMAHVSVQGLPGTKPREVKLSFVAEILGARAEELFEVIKAQLIEKNLISEINGGYVITGGGALIKGFPELAEYILEKPTKIGYPISFGGMTSVMQNPIFSTVLGLLLEAEGDVIRVKSSARQSSQINFDHNDKTINKDFVEKFSNSLKSVFKEIF
jgi:cell division protein FtsA